MHSNYYQLADIIILQKLQNSSNDSSVTTLREIKSSLPFLVLQSVAVCGRVLSECEREMFIVFFISSAIGIYGFEGALSLLLVLKVNITYNMNLTCSYSLAWYNCKRNIDKSYAFVCFS